MDSLWQNLRFGSRMLVKNRGVSVIALLTLVLGIGANLAMFAILNGVLLRPLPYPEAGQLVRINTQWKDFGLGSVNPLEFFDMLERTSSFESIGLYRWISANLLEGDGEVEQVAGVRATASLFEVLGVEPALGRLFRPEESFVGGTPVVLVSDRLWKRRFGADPGLVGRNLHLLEESYQVVGIMGPEFEYPGEEVDLWVSYGIDRDNLGNRGSHSSAVIARLKEALSLDQAQADLDTLSAQLRVEHPGTYPEASGFRLFGRDYRETLTGEVRPALLVLMGAVGFVLLIACANVANLLLAGISGRRTEMAIRSALGASRHRIVGQILTESFLLCLGGGLGSIGVAVAAYRGLLWLHPDSVPRLSEVRLDTNVWIFSFFLLLLVTMATGLIPALQVAGRNTEQQLREGGRQGSAGGRFRTRAVLVVGEVALATVLLIGAGLLIRTFQQLLETDPGFVPEQVLTTEITLPSEEYPDHARRVAFYQELVERLAAQPGILSAAGVNILPMSSNDSDNALSAEGYVPANPDVPDFIQVRMASPDYFKTMGIPVEQGRSFNDQDRAESQRVVILSRSLARKFWGDQNPLGRRVREGGARSTAPWSTVVGIVGDVFHRGAREGAVPMFYRPLYQSSWGSISLAVRAASRAEQAEGLMRAALREINPRIAMSRTRPSTEMVAETLGQEQFNASLLILFASLALLLAAIGIFGVISCSVGQRTQEIGVRMALGAARVQVLRQMLREGIALVSIGLVLGLFAAFWLSRILTGLLFGVEPWDPFTYGVIAGLLYLTGVAACWGPASRATRIDPIAALRKAG